MYMENICVNIVSGNEKQKLMWTNIRKVLFLKSGKLLCFCVESLKTAKLCVTVYKENIER